MQQKRMLHSFVVLVFLFVLTLIAGWSDTDIAKTNAQEIGTDEIEDETEEGTEVINSNIEIETDIDKFDFNNPAKYYKAETCEKCLTFSNYTR